jgi:hypothetical protein
LHGSRGRRHRHASRERQCRIDDTCRQPLCAGNEQGVEGGNLACEVIVNGPAETRPGNHQRTKPSTVGCVAVWPGKRHATGDDQDHPQHDASIDILFESKPCQDGG